LAGNVLSHRFFKCVDAPLGIAHPIETLGDLTDAVLIAIIDELPKNKLKH
jgi:hypothetical protein